MHTPNIYEYTWCLKKRNLFDLEYLKDGLIKLIVLLGGYLLLLPYNSISQILAFYDSIEQ